MELQQKVLDIGGKARCFFGLSELGDNRKKVLELARAGFPDQHWFLLQNGSNLRWNLFGGEQIDWSDMVALVGCFYKKGYGILDGVMGVRGRAERIVDKLKGWADSYRWELEELGIGTLKLRFLDEPPPEYLKQMGNEVLDFALHLEKSAANYDDDDFPRSRASLQRRKSLLKSMVDERCLILTGWNLDN